MGARTTAEISARLACDMNKVQAWTTGSTSTSSSQGIDQLISSARERNANENERKRASWKWKARLREFLQLLYYDAYPLRTSVF